MCPNVYGNGWRTKKKNNWNILWCILTKMQYILYIMVQVFNFNPGSRDTLNLVTSARKLRLGQNLTYKYCKMTQTVHPNQHKTRGNKVSVTLIKKLWSELNRKSTYTNLRIDSAKKKCFSHKHFRDSLRRVSNLIVHHSKVSQSWFTLQGRLEGCQ